MDLIRKGKIGIYELLGPSKWIFATLLCFQMGLVCAQNQYQTFTNYTIDDGFQSMINYDVVQDQRGYIWIATDAGISRFNGKDFKNFGLKEGLEQNEVVSMAPDAEGRIWLNSSGRISYLQNDSIIALDLAKSKDLHWNFNALSDDKNLWLNIKSKLYYLNQDLEKIPFENPIDTNKTNRGYLIVGNYEENTILFLEGNLEFRVNGELKRKVKIDGSYQLYDIQNHQFFIEDEYLYYNCKLGLVKMNLKTLASKVISPDYKRLRKIHKIGNKIWIAKQSRGMLCLTIENDEVITIHEFLDDILCSNFIFDDQQNIWVASYGRGLFFFPKQYDGISNFTNELDEMNTYLQSMLVDKDDIWFGKLDGSLSKISGNQKKTYTYKPYRRNQVNRILKIQKLAENKLVMASDDGLLFFEDEKITVKHGMATKNVQVTGDSLLVNNYSYTYKVSIDDFVSQEITLTSNLMNANPKINKLLHGRSYSSIVDSKNNIWIASTEVGLIEYKKDGRIINHTQKNNLLNVSIVDIVELENGAICLATNGEGIILISENKIQQIDIEHGLSSDICFDLLVEGKVLYVSTNKGVNIIEFDNHNSGSYKISILDKMNGLLSNDTRCIDYYDRKLFIASSDGYSVVQLDSLKTLEYLPPIQIENIEVNQRKVKVQDQIYLNHNQNSLKIDFSAISFIRNEQNVYAYRMGNVDDEDDWTYTTTNEIQYSHLKPGKYKFEVKHANSTATESLQKVLFEIKPHFSQTSIFKLIVGFIFFGLFGSTLMYLITRGQKRELKKLVNLKTNELQEKVSDLAQSNNKLEKSNEELERFAYVTSHDLKSPLRSVGSFIELLAKKNEQKFDTKDKEYLHFILTSVNKMNQVIKDLLTLSRIGNSDQESKLVNSKDILVQVIENNSYLINEKNTKISFTGEFPILKMHSTELGSLFQNLITNAIKYNDSPQPTINIKVKKSKTEWIFAVADNGIGINPKFGDKIFDLFQRLHTDKEYSGTGIGLSICQKIIERQGGKIWFESELKQGSTFYFSVPHSLSKLDMADKIQELKYN